MADVFISYARSDQPAAEKLARLLERAGYSVWWDRNIQSGAEFSKDIQTALDAAKVVLVLWSKASVDSHWVKDEAEFARAHGKLMPVSLDGIEPPLGFRQVQCADISGWSGGDDARVQGLIAAVASRLGGAAAAAVGASGASASPSRRAGRAKAAAVAAGALALCAAGVAAVFAVIDRQPPQTAVTASPADTAPGAAPAASPGRNPVSEAASVPAEKSVAVLPFVALSSGEDDGYFADGLTEEIINALTTLPDLLVTARTSAFHFKGKDVPIPEIAKTLGVAHVVEGSVRRSGDSVRITAQLIRASDGFHLWSETYDRGLDDVFAAQTAIAESIAHALGVLLDERKRALMADVGVRDVEAFLAFQRGVALFGDAHDDAPQIQTLQRANGEFERAIARKPDFAQAHFLHADFYAHTLMDELSESSSGLSSTGLSREEALRRLAEDLDAAARYETDPGQRLVIRAVRTFLSPDWRGLGEEMDRAFASWDNCRNGGWMDPMGTPFGRAEHVLRRSVERTRCDPLEAVYWTGAVDSAIMLGRLDEAERLLDDAEALGVASERTLVTARLHLFFAQGRHEEAGRLLAKSPNAEAENFVRVPAAAGRRAEALAAHERYRPEEGDPHLELIAHAVAGDREGANRIAAAIDAQPLGAASLTRASNFCLCGAPFDLEATPNFARQLKEGDLPWPPKSPIDWPLKDW